jgi:hypothetical protein
MHVVRQDPRMVRFDSDRILGHSARALPRMREFDLDTVSVDRSCDGNIVRSLRAVCCWALANNMIQRSKGLSVSRTPGASASELAACCFVPPPAKTSTLVA